MIARVRTISEALEELKAVDPGTAITSWAIRRLVRNGEIPNLGAAGRILINFDLLIDFLNRPSAPREVVISPARGVYRID
jgi:hypothetical protein